MNKLQQTLAWGNLKTAKILAIGHDPRLQTSDTIAEYCFFADYFFKPIPPKKSERKKYQLASTLFDYIMHLTNHQYTADQLYITNLCNEALDHAPTGKMVLIPEKIAKLGVADISNILEGSKIQLIFAMSQQVNYWLQKFELYSSGDDFMEGARPKKKGLESNPPYYEPKNSDFKQICGNIYTVSDKYKLVPILHAKNWPLNKKFAPVYQECVDRCVNGLKV